VNDVRELIQVLQEGGEIAQNVYVPILIGKSFRLEPHLGIYSYSREREESKNNLSSFQLGIGIFPMLWRNQTILYFGGRLGLIFSSETSEYEDWDDTWEKNEESGGGFFFAPTIGGECFVCEKLSLGGEVQLKWLFSNWEDEDNNKDDTLQYFTRTLFFIRFYFN